ncbi:Tetratricopeptide repeat, putative [Trypanosoma equiperdum]|uniref:MalT-like TPR region domain-containing protein n=4 Tax=Trypanozoon TaxID=39700 RepID=Q385V8_TRYB2|nr:hypothetical protein, conserved [Trypanosoma brucei gambiense DAL972]XP_828535.1 hypothetical protein, conserved [Trypanosoma brucei brucei TREU927]RHW67259.1 Tetratricopeptide repeat [Trypanosoma brucei equiperdum]SCU70033.1 Tetratricopeptide repeat, putative [Trypanosoma equiperdum]EAN79423.1 hypothetical protein, conserved [Trypanosoma brucei brucei TREU927]CBH17406.1 hypothetical protein, conserved [Trypanosoma brucei gambiense DAL972]|eukprot:XP_011779670.1 hypothetical protein, conserved [Trypanosoma brucei gambiense DAL972]
MPSVLVFLRDALAHYESGELCTARQAAEEALHAAQPHEHEAFADSLLLLGNISAAEGDFITAERYAATCSCYVEEHLGPQHNGAAVVRLNRAIFLLESLRVQSVTTVAVVEEAHALLLEAEQLLVNVCHVGRLVLAEVLHNIGVCCALLGRYVAALTAYMRSMQIRVRFKDAARVTDLKLALTMEQVALLYRLMDEPKRQEAALLMEVVASTRRQLLGPHHPLLAAAVLAQGVIAAELGQRCRAQSFLRNALEMFLSLYGKESFQLQCAERLLAEVS